MADDPVGGWEMAPWESHGGPRVWLPAAFPALAPPLELTLPREQFIEPLEPAFRLAPLGVLGRRRGAINGHLIPLAFMQASGEHVVLTCCKNLGCQHALEKFPIGLRIPPHAAPQIPATAASSRADEA